MKTTLTLSDGKHLRSQSLRRYVLVFDDGRPRGPFIDKRSDSVESLFIHRRRCLSPWLYTIYDTVTGEVVR